MKIHHLVHNEFGSSNYSQVQKTESLNIFSLQNVDSTNSFRDDTSFFPSNKCKSSKISFDQVSVDTSVTHQMDNFKDEFHQFFVSENSNTLPVNNLNNNKESSNSIPSSSQFQTSFELPLLSTMSTFNSSSLVPDLLLVNSDLWSQFYRVNNEMIITKAGRCIFPLLKYLPVNLDPSVNYSFVIDFVQLSKNRYRFKKGCWISIGSDKRKFLPNIRGDKSGTVYGNPFTHPNSPQSGAYWMNFGVSFPKIKLTNRLRQSSSSSNTRKRDSTLPPGHFYLTSFHKYWPRIKMIKHTANEDQESFFTFEETKFIAVTHYQNEQVNTLKKNNNPHAKGLKGSFKDKNNPYDSESEISDIIVDSEVDDNEDISDTQEENSSLYLLTTESSNKLNDSISLEQKIQQWKKGIEIETRSISIDYVPKPNVTRKTSDDDMFHTNQTSLYQNMGGYKVVKNAHYTSDKKHEYHPSSGIVDNTTSKRPKLDRITSFSEVQQQNKQQETQSQIKQFQQQNTHRPTWNYYSAPKTPLSPGNIFYSTISNNKISSNVDNSISSVRLEQAENENKRLREFIRERYGYEAEKEADAVVALGGKDI
ncbi:hypothetical protein C1645_826917 [Glomus cerebriforme]|uniref:T-box domain-containing protein n=1 Tax=Glomus cerebriforme TaxID=658196 RepID=A0A397ST38_9GLOM|nr:hypothetical protein C1645_826917 [Glomus cerebriforme]